MTTPARVLKIGIAPREKIQAMTLAVARGERKISPDDPRIWFTSMESLAQILSTKNRLLLEIIARSKPTSLKELAEATGRHVSNLSRTLQTMERYGLVRLQREGNRVAPEVAYDRLELDIPLFQDRVIASRRTERHPRAVEHA